MTRPLKIDPALGLLSPATRVAMNLRGSYPSQGAKRDECLKLASNSITFCAHEDGVGADVARRSGSALQDISAADVACVVGNHEATFPWRAL